MMRTAVSPAVTLALAFAVLPAMPVGAQLAEDTPKELQGIEITDRPGSAIPLDLEFRNERDEPVRLGEYFTGDRPVILQLGYYRCPMLCGLVMNAMLDGMRDLAWMPGKEYEVLSVSIDPLETPALANAKKQSAVNSFDRAGAGAGWHFLTGREAEIRALAEAVGFGYRYVPERKEYAHAAGIFVLTADGHVSRTLYGIDFPAKTLRLALVEAGQGKVGNAFDQVLLYCYHYDATSGRYGPEALKLMRAGAAATLLVLGCVLLGLWTRESRRRDRVHADGGNVA